MTVDDFKKYFDYLKKESKNFSNFDYRIIQETPQFIGIFRIIANLGHRQFSKLLNQNSRVIRKHEFMEYRLLPETAQKYTNVIKKTFENKNLIGKVSLKDAIVNFKRIRSYDIFEEAIIQILNKNNINYNLHYNFVVNNKTINIDF